MVRSSNYQNWRIVIYHLLINGTWNVTWSLEENEIELILIRECRLLENARYKALHKMPVGCHHNVQMLKNYSKCGKLERSGMPEADSESNQTSKMFSFSKTVNGFQALTKFFAKTCKNLRCLTGFWIRLFMSLTFTFLSLQYCLLTLFTNPCS